jgi:hypothetical protein
MKPLDLTPEQIAPAFPSAPLANIARYWPFVAAALQADQLIGAQIVAYTLGTIAAETAGFEPLTEQPSKFNTDRVPFDVYDMRGNLGNLQLGDGPRFKGRGFIQLTGRANYRRYGERIGMDLEADPDQANDPQIAAQLLSLFICDREDRILAALQAQDYAKARRAANGGSHGLERFKTAFEAILGVLRT